MTVIDEIAAERRRQVEAEGWTPEHDDDHRGGQMALAAAAYAIPHPLLKRVPRERTYDLGREGWRDSEDTIVVPQHWPWEGKWWKPGDERRNLVKAAALIVAEIERLDRAALKAAA